MDDVSEPVLVPLSVSSCELTDETEDSADERIELAALEAGDSMEAVTEVTTPEEAVLPRFVDGAWERRPWAWVWEARVRKVRIVGAVTLILKMLV